MLPRLIGQVPKFLADTIITPKGEMPAKVLCSPPLGQSTVVPASNGSATFQVVIEGEPGTKDQGWEVNVWHNLSSHDKWQALPLLEDREAVDFLVLGDPKPNEVSRRVYTAELQDAGSDQPVSFTVRFRQGSNDSWIWVRDVLSTPDGHIYFQRDFNKDADLSHYINGLSPELEIKKEAPETVDTTLWYVTGPVAPAAGDASGVTTHKLGFPSNFSRWFSLVRIWSPWLAPRHGRQKFWPDKESVLAAFLRHDGLSVVVLAVSGVDDVLTLLHHDDEGNVIITSRNDREKQGLARVVVAVAQSFEIANAAVMYHARKLVSAYETETGEMQKEMDVLKNKDVKAEWLENWYDGLAYCTWNGLGQNLTEEKVFSALDSMAKNDIKITNLIIDDNWQSLDNEGEYQDKRGMTEFSANKKAFPRGMKALTDDIRKNYPSIKYIAVWHAILGYWGGISPDGELAQRYKVKKVKRKHGDREGWMTVVDAEDVPRFYDDWYRYLSNSGIDGVKTDAQFFLDELEYAEDRRRLIRTYQDSWTISHLRHFASKAISCMSQLPQVLFHTQLPTNKPRLLVRNSDDFFPEVPASHPWHIYCNAHNSLLTQHLNVLPDWDMFQTSHSYASFHAAARCVSGGPIYFTDEPGKHDIDLIHQMTAQTPRGNTVILRPHTVGKSTEAYTGYEEQALLKISTYVGRASTGSSILGVFNVTQGPISEIVHLSNFPGAEEGRYIIRSHKNGAITKPMTSKDKKGFVVVDVPVQGWEILTAYPLSVFTLKRSADKEAKGDSKVEVANLGLLGKMSGAAAVVDTMMHVDEQGKLRIWTSLKALGTLGFYISNLEDRSLDDDFMGLIFGKPIPAHSVKKSETPNVLEIDLAQAWKESDQKAGWSNEVNVELFIR